jgi:hypothetical protein
LRSNATKHHDVVLYSEKKRKSDAGEKRIEADDKRDTTDQEVKRAKEDLQEEVNESKRNVEAGARILHSESVKQKNSSNEQNIEISVPKLKMDDVSVALAQCARDADADNSQGTKTVVKGELSAQYAAGIVPFTSYPESKDSSHDNTSDLVSAQWVIVTQSDESSDLVPTLTWEATIPLPTLNAMSGCHISCVASDKVWVSDASGSLHLMDLQKNVLGTLQTRSGGGFHTVTPEGELLYADTENKRILKVKIKQKNSQVFKTSIQAVPFSKTGHWTPLSIYSSRYTGDLLVGMLNGGRARVMRYDSKGKEKQQIEFDKHNTALYRFPQFVTENANLNIITSDRTSVVAVDIDGGKRWSYSGPTKTGSGFLPSGICCDMLMNIVLYDVYSNNVYLLDRDGEFLGRLLVLGNAWIPQGLCFDEENRLYCGDRSKVLVYKYEHNMA